MNDGVFGANSGQKKALSGGGGGDGVFDAQSGQKKAHGALAKVDNGKGSALAQYVKEGAGKLAAIVAAGKDVQMDAQRVMFFLSSYGEGDKLGRYVFTSMELVGRGAYEADVRDITYAKDPANPLGSGIPQETTRKVPVDAISPTEDGLKLDMSGVRLRDAVHLLREQGWVETTSDGDFGQDCDFSSVKLTAKGREIALTAVKKAMKKGGARFEDDGFAGMPDLFDPGFGGASAPQLTDLQQQQGMLSRAKVPFTVEHSDDGERTIININDKPAFVFDAEGALVNTGKDAKDGASASESGVVDEKKDGE